ncbi:MAG TPA: TonB-dependent receptor [Steroidobacteraceae bacterium]|nr:TonB-dependent receptor [Steroidobacteraceae bacterium]
MNTYIPQFPSATPPRPRRTLRHVVALTLAGSASLLAHDAFAQDARSAEQIQAEVARLKEQLAKEEQALAEKNGQAAAAPKPAAATAAAPANEENRLGKVTVRARNRLEPLQDVPLAISVVTGAELERTNAFDIDAITRRAANVAWNQGNQRTSSLSIRGIGGKQGQTEAQDPSVGVVVDGINYAYNALTSSFNFVDVDTVEVSRGPQGTLLGKNTSMGVINIATRKPSFTPSVDYGVTIGDWDTVQGRLAGGGPVVDDKLAWRGTLVADHGQGDVVNRYNRDETWQNKDRVYGKLQLLFTPSDDLSIRVLGEKQSRGSETTNGRTINTPTPLTYADGSPNTALQNSQRLQRRWFTQNPNFNVDDDYFFLDDEVNYNNQHGLVTGSNGGLIDVNWQLGNYNLVSISGYKDYHFDATNDEGSTFDVYRNAGGFWNDYKQWSQELRVASNVGELVDYQTGLFYLKVNNKADYRREWGNDAGAWFATNAQYGRLDANAAGRQLLVNSLTGLNMDYSAPSGIQDIDNESKAIFGQANWHITPAFTLTTGARVTREDRQNRATSRIRDNGAAPELNPDVVNNVSLGGFSSDAATGALLGGNSLAQLQLADIAAGKYFGTTINPAAAAGSAYASLTAAQQRQIADAKAIRRTAIGVVFPWTDAESFKETQYSFVVAPSYKINEQYTTYFSWQYSEKAGISQFVNGLSSLVPGEESTSYELGLKSVLLDRTLTLNVAAFYMELKNYQQNVRIVDEYTTALNFANGNPTIAYVTATGTVPKVKAKGVEVDAFYVGIPHTSLRLSASYNDAYFADFPNNGQPNENGFTGAPPYQDVSGRTLPGANKWQANLGLDFHYPVFSTLEFITSANAAYNSSFNSDNVLSSYAEIEGKTVFDLAIGLGRQDRSLQAVILAKNVFNDATPLAQTWNTVTPAVSRWVGVSVTGKL